jgi:hypothetical protein
MRALEARYHPFERQGPTFVVVGHIVWDDDAARVPRVEPSSSLPRHTAPGTMLATLRHLVAMTSPRSYERLQALRSRFWSFVRVDDLPPANGPSFT